MVICPGESNEVTFNANFTTNVLWKIFLSIFFSVALVFLYFPPSTQMGAYVLLSMIALRHALFTFVENNCHRQMCFLCAVLKPWDRKYRCIHKHHHQLSGGFPGYPFFLFQCVIQMQWSLQMIIIQIFPTLLFLCPSTF